MVSYSSCRITFAGLILLLVSSCGVDRCEGLGEFGFEFHHRFSDQVLGVFPGDGLPHLDSSKYYRVMAHRDRLIRGRRLANQDQPLVTFADGNETVRLNGLGFLHYANVTVGTPSSWFLVALDTGSDLFWLPCDCTSCVRKLKAPGGSSLELNIYSSNASSTSSKVPCNSTLCKRGDRCASPNSNCPYQIRYLSNGTSSTGVLVEDVLHLVSNEKNSKAIPARITLGCGQVQTGVFHDGAAPNGLFGLGLDDISVPSVLAKEGIAANSFSMCFGKDGAGRISFGDKGSVDQRETPLNIRQPHPTYNITVTQISVGGNTDDLKFDAVFDSGTSFTYLTDAAYTLISESFNSQAMDKRYQTDSKLPFEYCYASSPSKDSIEYPAVNLTMKGGSSYHVYHPLVVFPMKDTDVYCLAIIKIEDISIIGQNFMNGYRIVFDREKLTLGWKESDCYTGETSARTLPSNRSTFLARPPASSFAPEATNIPSPLLQLCPSPYNLSHFPPNIFLSSVLESKSAMGVAVLQPTDPLSIRNIIFPPPHRPDKPTPNRRRRSPPRHQPETSPPPKGSKKKKKNLNHNHVRVPKRGEEKVPDLTVEKPDPRSARQIVSDPVTIPSQSRRSTTPALFYAGTVTSTSPPPSEVPLPAFFAKRSVSSFEPADATTDLIRILGIDVDRSQISD